MWYETSLPNFEGFYESLLDCPDDYLYEIPYSETVDQCIKD